MNFEVCVLLDAKGNDIMSGPFEEMVSAMRGYEGMDRVVRSSDRAVLATKRPWRGYWSDTKRKSERCFPVAPGYVAGVARQ